MATKVCFTSGWCSHLIWRRERLRDACCQDGVGSARIQVTLLHHPARFCKLKMDWDLSRGWKMLVQPQSGREAPQRTGARDVNATKAVCATVCWSAGWGGSLVMRAQPGTRTRDLSVRTGVRAACALQQDHPRLSY